MPEANILERCPAIHMLEALLDQYHTYVYPLYLCSTYLFHINIYTVQRINKSHETCKVRIDIMLNRYTEQTADGLFVNSAPP